MCWSKNEADVIRDMIKHESTVTDHRLQWLLTANGLLFTAAALVLKNAPEALCVISIVGIWVTASTSVPLYYAAVAIQRLMLEWEKCKPRGYDGPPVIGYWAKGKLIALIQPSLTIPLCMIIAWICLLWRFK